MILLSAHLDRVVQDYDLSFNAGKFKGLLDNVIGIITVYLSMFDDVNLLKFEQEGKIRLFHSKYEEWGRKDGFPKLSKDDIVISVDVDSDSKEFGGQQYDFHIKNMYGFTKAEIKDFKEHMEWEGFNVLFQEFNNDPMKEDETWKWHGTVKKAMSFFIPCTCKNDGWHRIQMDNEISSDKVLRCRQGLKRVVNYFLDEVK
jgi:hypothetical protein